MKDNIHSNAEYEYKFWRKDSIGMWFIIAVALFGVLGLLNINGVFDSPEVKEEKRLAAIESNLEWKEYRAFKAEISQNIKDGNLSCEYITELLEYDSRAGYMSVTSGSLEKGLRLYWNANSCGFEWNWYD